MEFDYLLEVSLPANPSYAVRSPSMEPIITLVLTLTGSFNVSSVIQTRMLPSLLNSPPS